MTADRRLLGSTDKDVHAVPAMHVGRIVMKPRMIVGLLIALLLTATLAVPTLAKPGNGTVVKKGVGCEVDASAMGLGTLGATKARWIEKRNGQASKLRCRFKGVDMDGWNKTRRLTSFACAVPAGVEASDWTLVRSRLKVNQRGNGWLKCRFTPVV